MKVKFGMVRTIQTKQFESIRIEVAVEDEVDLSQLPNATKAKQMLDNMYKALSKFVRDKIEEEEDRWL